MITEETTVLEVVRKYPEARRVFGAYNLRYGTCITCGSLFYTVEELATSWHTARRPPGGPEEGRRFPRPARPQVTARRTKS